jgi:hypothetical protein
MILTYLDTWSTMGCGYIEGFASPSAPCVDPVQTIHHNDSDVEFETHLILAVW